MDVILPQAELITLRDGMELTLRAIAPEDDSGLVRLFHRLSPESVFLRFLAVVKELSETQARQLSRVDYRTAMAFVAVYKVEGEEEILGVARYAAVVGAEPGFAEAAVAVEDQFQRRGVGTLLLNRLVSYALAHGVHTFVVNVHSSNEVILKFIRRSGLPFESRWEAGVWVIHVKLDPELA